MEKQGKAYILPAEVNLQVKGFKFRLILFLAAICPWKTKLKITIEKGAIFVNPPSNEYK